MNGYRLSVFKRVIALALIVGALPFVNNAGAREQGETDKWKWLDDPHEHVGLTYGAQATLNAAYLWRGIFAGGTCLQPSAEVGYGGLYANMWWSIGATDMTFKQFLPELDLTLGFSRWGLNVFVLYIHNFDCGFFDFNNYHDKGNRLELDVLYTVSSKIPLTIHWATRVSAGDGYLRERITEEGLQVTDTVRAWSSYLELSYTQRLRDGYSLYYAIGMTPWRSCYSGYERGAGLQNIEMQVRKDWELASRCGLRLFGQLAVCPTSAIRPINVNLGVSVYLK